MPVLRQTATALLACSVPALFMFAAVPAMAQSQPDAETSAHTFTANVSVATDYRYRGLMQTNRQPAIQGGFDYSHSSGFYLGNWNSSISWLGDSNAEVSALIEMDFYGGYKGTFGGDWSYDIGVLQYYYPGDYPAHYTRPYTTEVYAGLGYGPVTLKYSYAPTNLFGCR